MIYWMLVLYFATGETATLQRPFASRESCEITAVVTERRIAIEESLRQTRMPRLAYAACVATTTSPQ